jgi:hypothetical protein
MFPPSDILQRRLSVQFVTGGTCHYNMIQKCINTNSTFNHTYIILFPLILCNVTRALTPTFFFPKQRFQVGFSSFSILSSTSVFSDKVDYLSFENPLTLSPKTENDKSIIRCHCRQQNFIRLTPDR